MGQGHLGQLGSVLREGCAWGLGERVYWPPTQCPWLSISPPTPSMSHTLRSRSQTGVTLKSCPWGRGKSLRHTPGDPSSFLALEIVGSVNVLLSKMEVGRYPPTTRFLKPCWCVTSFERLISQVLSGGRQERARTYTQAQIPGAPPFTVHSAQVSTPKAKTTKQHSFQQWS